MRDALVVYEGSRAIKAGAEPAAIRCALEVRGAMAKRATRMGCPFCSSGAGDRSRTYDLRITNALLYQLSYTGETLTCENLCYPCHLPDAL